MKRWLAVVYEFACILSISLVLGIGIGGLQGIIAFRSSTYAEGGATIGGIVAVIVGPFVYYTFLRKYLTVKDAANLIMICLAAGLLSALMFGWGSLAVTPLALFLGALRIWRKGIGVD